MSLVSATPNQRPLSETDDEDDKRPGSSSTTDSTQSPSVLSANNENDSSDVSTPERNASSDTESPEKRDASIAENAFDSEKSRSLFDAIDKLQSYGAGKYINIPQLVIVGGQSTGKSSLLRSLTDIPFRVGTDICTRFATRIVSRRTAPGTKHEVKITIVPPEFKVEHSVHPSNESYREYVKSKDSLTAEEFSSIMEEVTTKYMGINPGKSSHNKNFAYEVLKVEISGPARSHFSILDIPGIFSNDFSVKKGEMDGVRSMVIEYMKQPENIVICVADAATDLAMQEIFKLAEKYVEKTRLIGVFTKCDLLRKADSVINIADGRVEGVGQLLHHGWFVVRNIAEGDEEEPNFDLQRVEADLFSKHPWTQIREDRRGSAMLKRYLGDLLCNKIADAFPHFLDRLADLLDEAKASRARLGDPRDSNALRRAYLADIAKRYETGAMNALERPWLLERVQARVRNLIRDKNDKFGKGMRELGHTYEFVDHDLTGEDIMQRLRELIKPGTAEATVNAQRMSQSSSARPRNPDRGVRKSEELLAKIRDEVVICGCTELPGMVHPDVVRRLYKDQTRKWRGMAEEHLNAVATGVHHTAKEIIGTVCPPGGGTGTLHTELLVVVDRFYNDALGRALQVLGSYCDGDQTKLLQTTDPGFTTKLQLLQSWRMMETMNEAMKIFTDKKDDMTETLQLLLWENCHHATAKNMVNEIHDTLKVYYEFSLQSFIRHINNNVVEDFVMDPLGPLRGFSTNYVNSLSNDEVDRLGRESRDVVEEREQLDRRISTLQAASTTAREALERTRTSD